MRDSWSNSWDARDPSAFRALQGVVAGRAMLLARVNEERLEGEGWTRGSM
jgi:hypothetical protein